MVNEPYRIEVDAGGCEHCGHGKTWTVVGPDDIAEGESWFDEQDAQDVADRMNRAYEAGQNYTRAASSPIVGARIDHD